MDKKMDEVVEVNVVTAASGADATNVNTVAIVPISATSPIESAAAFTSLSDVGTAFGASSEAYHLAESFFGQDVRPDELVVIPVASQTPSVITAALNAAMADFDFYHVILRAATASDASTIVTLESALQTWAAENYRFCHVEVTDRTIADAVMASLADSLPPRVATYFHESTGDLIGECFPSGLAASRCGVDPARGTWAHKTVTGLTASSMTTALFAAIKTSGLNVYVKIAGTLRSFFGTAGGPTLFIDSQIKKDWVKFRVAEEIYNLLGSANDGYGVNYSDAGIQGIGAAITHVLTLAADNDHQYIMDDFTVTMPSYSSIASAQKAERNLPNGKATFSIMNSVHTVESVTLTVVL